MSEKPVREYDKFMLRFPDGMRDAVSERAKANGRSMNAEIIQMIEDQMKSYPAEPSNSSIQKLESAIGEQRELIYRQSMLAKQLATSLHKLSNVISPEDPWTKNLKHVLEIMEKDPTYQKAEELDKEQKKKKSEEVLTNKKPT